MSMPTDLSNEAAAWMHTQIAIANARSAALLREEIDRLDDWANGLYLVLLNVLPFLMKAHPEMARQVEPQWRSAAERFEALADGARSDDGETAELLEARKMLHSVLTLLHAWPAQQPGAQAKSNRRTPPSR